MQLNETKRAGTADLLGPPEQEHDDVKARIGDVPLLPPDEARALQDRWAECQGSFVDEPRDSVQAADELVAEVMQKLARQFADSRKALEEQWSRGDNVSTEDLRIALQRYRDFFNRLLAV